MKERLRKGIFPDPEHYVHIGGIGNWKAYAARDVRTDTRFVQVRLVSVVPTVKPNAFLTYMPEESRFVRNAEWVRFSERFPDEASEADRLLEKYLTDVLGDQEGTGERNGGSDGKPEKTADEVADQR